MQTNKFLLSVIILNTFFLAGCNTSEAYRRYRRQGYNLSWDNSYKPSLFRLSIKDERVCYRSDKDEIDAMMEAELSRTGRCPKGYIILEKGYYGLGPGCFLKGECRE
jgi:hypothetical protein